MYCVAIRHDLGNAVSQKKFMECTFAPDSHQDVGFSLCFLQQQGQELICSWLCILPRDRSGLFLLPSIPVSGDVCCSHRQVLGLCACSMKVTVRIQEMQG